MTSFLKAAWRAVGAPVYERLFGRYFRATISRLNTTIDYVSGLQAELAELRTRVDELDAHVRTVIAAHWEDAALVRRMTMLEDRIERDGGAVEPRPDAQELRK